MEIGKRIAELRHAHGLSQFDLGKKLHVSSSTVGNWENSIRRISDEYIEELADIFSVSTDYLFGRELKNQTPLSLSKIPVIGKINAYTPIESISEFIEDVEVQPSVINKYGRKNLFALKIHGDSMNRVIPAGGIAVMLKTSFWDDGDICTVLVDNEDAVLRVLKKIDAGIQIEPRSYSRDYSAWCYNKESDKFSIDVIGKFLYGIIPGNELI